VNKSELIDHVAKKTGMPKTKAGEAVEAIFDGIKTSLKKGGEVRLVGFGTFSVAKRAATTGRNPRTGEKINIPASKQPKFKAGKDLKEAVNK
jgi:DNA-binding protein HU-beta